MTTTPNQSILFLDMSVPCCRRLCSAVCASCKGTIAAALTPRGTSYCLEPDDVQAVAHQVVGNLFPGARVLSDVHPPGHAY